MPAEEVAEQLAGAYRQRLTAALPSRVEFVSRGFDFQAAELAALRARLTVQARDGVRHAQSELTRVKERQRSLYGHPHAAVGRAPRRSGLHPCRRRGVPAACPDRSFRGSRGDGALRRRSGSRRCAGRDRI